MKQYYVYFLTNKPKGTIYIGVTSNLIQRYYEHTNHVKSGFPTKYKLYKLVRYEIYNDVRDAIEAEKKLKNLSRDKKIQIIEKDNPNWDNLGKDIFR